MRHNQVVTSVWLWRRINLIGPSEGAYSQDGKQARNSSAQYRSCNLGRVWVPSPASAFSCSWIIRHRGEFLRCPDVLRISFHNPSVKPDRFHDGGRSPRRHCFFRLRSGMPADPRCCFKPRVPHVPNRLADSPEAEDHAEESSHKAVGICSRAIIFQRSPQISAYERCERRCSW
jgi:hypothetical protein